MTSKFESLVSISDLCSSETNKPNDAVYDIWMAPEIKYRGIAAITDEKYVRGRNLLVAKRKMASTEIIGDLLKLLSVNNYTNESVEGGSSFYEAAIPDMKITNTPLPLNRGISIHAAKPGGIRKLHIKDVHIYPVKSIDSIQLKIWDNGLELAYDVKLIGGQKNTFNIDYHASGDVVRVYIDNSILETYGTRITCMLGCNGSMPNPCGYVRGYNGGTEVKTEGFGISVIFGCACNYTSLLYSWGRSFMGEILFYKMRALVQEEVINSDRLNNFTIYNREQAKDKYLELENLYREKWNTFTISLPGLLKKVRDTSNCICTTTKYVTNI